MSEYKSEVKQIYYPIESVYGKLSDLSNLSVIKERMNDPAFEQMAMQQAGDKVKPEQVAQLKEYLQKVEFTPDTISGEAGMLGQMTLRIVDREPNKTIKFALEGAPVQANMWIQLLPASSTQCALRITVKADLNFFVRQMIGSKLEKGVEGLADMLSKIPYGY